MDNEYKLWSDRLEELCQVWLSQDGEYQALTMKEFLKHIRHEENLKVLNRIADSLEKLVESKQ